MVDAKSQINVWRMLRPPVNYGMLYCLLYCSHLVIMIQAETICTYHNRLAKGDVKIDFAASHWSSPTKMSSIKIHQLQIHHYVVADNWVYRYYMTENTQLKLINRFKLDRWKMESKLPVDGFFLSSLAFLCLRYTGKNFFCTRFNWETGTVVKSAASFDSAAEHSWMVKQTIEHAIGPVQGQLDTIAFPKATGMNLKPTKKIWKLPGDMAHDLQSKSFELVNEKIIWANSMDINNVIYSMPRDYTIMGMLNWVSKDPGDPKRYYYNMLLLLGNGFEHFYCINDYCANSIYYKKLSELYADDCGLKFSIIVMVIAALAGSMTIYVIVANIIDCFKKRRSKMESQKTSKNKKNPYSGSSTHTKASSGYSQASTNEGRSVNADALVEKRSHGRRSATTTTTTTNLDERRTTTGRSRPKPVSRRQYSQGSKNNDMPSTNTNHRASQTSALLKANKGESKNPKTSMTKYPVVLKKFLKNSARPSALASATNSTVKSKPSSSPKLSFQKAITKTDFPGLGSEQATKSKYSPKGSYNVPRLGTNAYAQDGPVSTSNIKLLTSASYSKKGEKESEESGGAAPYKLLVLDQLTNQKSNSTQRTDQYKQSSKTEAENLEVIKNIFENNQDTLTSIIKKALMKKD